MEKNFTFMFLATMLFVIGCKKDDESECVETFQGMVSLTPDERLLQPYKVNDTLVFFNSTLNSSITFTCNTQSSYAQTISENDPHNQGYAGCLGNYYKTEMYVTRFYQSLEQWINIWAYTRNPYDASQQEIGVQIGLAIPGDSIYPFDGYYAFRPDTLFNYPSNPTAHIVEFYPTISIGGKMYSNVYLLEGSHLFDNTERIVRISYSIKDGFLTFSTNRNREWILQKKIQ